MGRTYERVIYLPIEPIEMRYSADWYKWFQDGLTSRFPGKVVTIGDQNLYEIHEGEFLDVYDTNIYKARQLSQTVEVIKSMPDVDTLIFMTDGWFPGVEMFAYIRDILHLPITIKGIFHCGTYAKFDLLDVAGCESWGRALEESWGVLFDEIFVGSYHHFNTLTGVRRIHTKVTKVPYPVRSNTDLRGIKSNMVLYPHRFSVDKHPETFDIFSRMYKERYPQEEVEFVKSFDVITQKHDYYDLLRSAKVVFSGVRGEMFGIAMIEAVNAGAWPIAPNKFAYPETLGTFRLYENLDEAVELAHAYLQKSTIAPATGFTESVYPIVDLL